MRGHKWRWVRATAFSYRKKKKKKSRIWKSTTWLRKIAKALTYNLLSSPLDHERLQPFFFFLINKKGINLAKKKEKKTTTNFEMLPCFIGLLELKNKLQRVK